MYFTKINIGSFFGIFLVGWVNQKVGGEKTFEGLSKKGGARQKIIFLTHLVKPRDSYRVGISRNERAFLIHNDYHLENYRGGRLPINE